MGAPKQKWTSEEEDALRAGVDKHGAGKWRTIQMDPEFRHLLIARSNIDLKDKWRNLSVSASNLVGSKERPAKSPKLKALPAPPLAVSAPVCSPLVPAKPVSANQQANPKYHALILEALSTLKDPNGTDISAIHHFIEQKQEVPSNFRRVLGSKLRQLVEKDKIEKVSNGYRLKNASFVLKTPTSKPRDFILRTQPNQALQTTNLLSELANNAAYKIADAEAKSELAAEAVKEAEKISRMAEESDSFLQLARSIFEQCLRGEIVTMA